MAGAESASKKGGGRESRRAVESLTVPKLAKPGLRVVAGPRSCLFSRLLYRTVQVLVYTLYTRDHGVEKDCNFA